MKEDILRVGATNACLKVHGKNPVRRKGLRCSRKKGLPTKIVSENKKGIRPELYMDGPVFD